MASFQVDYNNDCIELSNFMQINLNLQFLINSKKFNIKNINNDNIIIFNIKTKNFKQDIGFVTFVDDSNKLFDNITIIKEFVFANNLNNWIFIIYFNYENFYIIQGYMNNIIKEMKCSGGTILPLLEDTLLKEGYNLYYKKDKSKLY